MNLSRSIFRSGRSRGKLLGVVLGTLLNAASILLLQILALVTLAPTEFGRFSALYLVSALSTSVLLSVVCEAWQRCRPQAAWKEYGATLFWLSVASAVITVVLCQLVPGLRGISYLGAAAVGFASYRTGARYFALQQRSLKLVLPGDVLSVLVLSVGWILYIFTDSLAVTSAHIVLLWAVSSVVSAIASKPVSSVRITAVRWWMAYHKKEIKTLLADSSILDASAIGTPYVLLPMLGVAGFGIYRALSNIAGPVKLLLFPLRPLFSSYSLLKFAGLLSLLGMSSIAGLLGALAYACLRVLELSAVELGTLTALMPHAGLASIFVGATFLNGVFYLVGRTHFSRKMLLSGRLVTSFIGIVLPVSGAVLWGLGGALLGVTVGTTAGALVWLILTIVESRLAPGSSAPNLGPAADVVSTNVLRNSENEKPRGTSNRTDRLP